MKLVFTRLAHRDLVRLRQFIAEHNPNAAARAAKRIRAVAQLLTDQPLVGRPVDAPTGTARNDIRELPLTFGSGGYILRYQVLQKQIRVLRIWHAREERKQDPVGQYLRMTAIGPPPDAGQPLPSLFSEPPDTIQAEQTPGSRHKPRTQPEHVV